MEMFRSNLLLSLFYVSADYSTCSVIFLNIQLDPRLFGGEVRGEETGAKAPLLLPPFLTLYLKKRYLRSFVTTDRARTFIFN